MDEHAAADRFAATVDLMETGFELMRQNLRRRHPEADEAEIEELLRAWLDERPPEHPGRVRRVL